MRWSIQKRVIYIHARRKVGATHKRQWPKRFRKAESCGQPERREGRATKSFCLICRVSLRATHHSSKAEIHNEGTEEVSRIMGGEYFIFPKPRSLIQTLLRQTTSGDDIVLDSFAGTGTTAHAVLALNKVRKASQDQGLATFTQFNTISLPLSLADEPDAAEMLNTLLRDTYLRFELLKGKSIRNSVCSTPSDT